MSRKYFCGFFIHLPFFLVISYLLVVIAVFWAGPLEWPVTNTAALAAFQGGGILIIVLGYLSSAPAGNLKRNVVNLRPVFYIGLVSVIILQIPVTLTYTGKYPWDVVQSIMDQRQTYEEMLEQVAEGQGNRFFVPLFRAMVSPLFYAAIGYGLMHFRHLKLLQRILLVIAILCPINLSLLRGTDKEMADVLIIVSGFLLVSYYREKITTNNIIFPSTSRGKMMILLTILIVCLFLAAFSYKKLERLGGNINFCFADGVICTDYSGFILSNLPDFVAFGFSMISFYLTNGYYGLSLALQQPFDFSFGVGHSAAFLSLYERFSGSSDLFDLSFIAKISAVGWDHRYYWATIFTWLANDLGFIGSLFAVGFMARWFRQSWSDAVYFNNDLAAIVFVFLCIAFVYLPANHQLAQTLDSYFSFIVTLVLWKLTRFSRKKIVISRSVIPVSHCFKARHG